MRAATHGQEEAEGAAGLVPASPLIAHLRREVGIVIDVADRVVDARQHLPRPRPELHPASKLRGGTRNWLFHELALVNN